MEYIPPQMAPSVIIMSVQALGLQATQMPPRAACGSKDRGYFSMLHA